MKARNLVPIMVIGCILFASVGYAQKATVTKDNLVTIDFIDSTGNIPVMKTVQMTSDEWTTIQDELSTIRLADLPAQEAYTAQVQVFQHHHLLPSTTRTEAVTRHFTSPRHLTAPLNNSNINAMCAINFQLTGTTAVLGLNSFINYLGFDIISFHKGNTTGITTTGILGSKTSPAGEYGGFMFGFLGYWVGERTQVGVYSSLTAVGFTVITAWVPLS